MECVNERERVNCRGFRRGKIALIKWTDWEEWRTTQWGEPVDRTEEMRAYWEELRAYRSS